MRAGWGGKRIGAGRKRKPASVVVHPSSVRSEPEAPAPAEEIAVPADLGPEEIAVWRRQAPAAILAGALTRGTSFAFARYCRLVVLERVEADGGGAAGSNHRGLLKLIESAESRFGLVPMVGRPAATSAKPATAAQVDPNEAYFSAPGR